MLSGQKTEIILGSQSPRRRELLGGLDIPFRSIVIDADESYPTLLNGGDIPAYISRAKAQAYLRQLKENELLITADTIVWLPYQSNNQSETSSEEIRGVMLGKPRDAEDACRMLNLLSGRTHQVYTGVTFALRDSMETIVDKTDVTFRTLSEEEIRYYVEHYKPLDKAGAYGVQEWIGYVGVERIEGSYFNVMGLPVERVYRYLVSKGII